MKTIFPEMIRTLPHVQVPVKGATGYLLQAASQQVVCMQFDRTVTIPEHTHENQWEIVLEGQVELTMNTLTTRYTKGMRFSIPKGTAHHATVHAGYACIMFFDQKDRYKKKEETTTPLE